MPIRTRFFAAAALGLLCTSLYLGCDRPNKDNPKANGKNGPNDGQSSKNGDASKPSGAPLADAKELRLVLTGLLQGHLEPCGCASAQSGGVDRRAFWLKLNKHRYDLFLEGGNLVLENNPLERHKLMTIQMILGGLLEYDIFPLGPNDLSLGLKELGLFMSEDGSPFVASDLRSSKTDSKNKAPFLTHAIRKAGSYKLLVVSLAGPIPKGVKGLERLAPQKALDEAFGAAGKRGEDWDCCLLFCNYGGAPEARRLAKTLRGVDVIASFPIEQETLTKNEVVARTQAEAQVSRVTILFPGWRGKNLLLWRAKPGADGSWHTVDASKESLQVPGGTPKGKRPPGSDAEVWQMLIDHKREIGDLDLLTQMAERKPSRNGQRYVGAKACAKCHKQAYETWKGSKHANAWKTLVDREKVDGWPVTKNPDCVSCHVVGYGEKSGFVNMTKTPELVDVSCENCHGAGSAHVEALTPIQAQLDKGEKLERTTIDAAIDAGKLIRPQASHCTKCHNFEQSPGFNYLEKWALIQHGLDKAR